MMMEAMACREGLMLARQYGIARIYLETDCLGLVKLWEPLDEQRSAVNPVCMQIEIVIG
jgi:hypothetical protein